MFDVQGVAQRDDGILPEDIASPMSVPSNAPLVRDQRLIDPFISNSTDFQVNPATDIFFCGIESRLLPL